MKVVASHPTILLPFSASMRILLSIWIAAQAIANTFAQADELPLRTKHVSQQLLVLNNGRVVSGQLMPRTGGYDVVLTAGRMFVASEQIRFRAVNMDDAYRRMRASLQQLTPTTHLELARWCVANKLPSQARRELLDALHLDPDHSGARLMLEGLTREEQRARQAATIQSNSERIQQFAEDLVFRDDLPERRSLGGLPGSLATTFTHNVQPLLSNKCGNARCHSAGRNGFTVISVRNGSSAVIAEQNLAAVLNQIDFRNVAESPLLKATTGLHGGSRQLLFPGQTGRRQLSILNEWIVATAKEFGPGEADRQTSSQHSSRPNQFHSVEHKTESSTDALSVPANNTGILTAVHSTKRDIADTDQQFSTEAVIATRHDEFDPNVFNRRFHGRSNAESRPEN